nr:hypothetical protein [Tanacetum cinerariifolium]
MSSKEATKGRSSIAPTGSKTGHIKRKKESSSIMDSNPSQTSASTIVVAEMHKEDQQATDSTAEADPGLSASNDSIPQQQCMDKGTKNTSFDHISAGKRASSITRQVKEEEASRTIKLEDQAKLMSQVQLSFKDLDSPEYDPIIVVVNSDEDEKANKDIVYTATNAETEDALVPKSLSLRSSQIQELTNQAIASKKTEDDSVPSAGQASTQPDEEEKNIKQINQQKKIEEEANAEVAKRESEVRKEELVDLLESRITNYDVLTKKGLIKLKVYREDGISEVIPNFKASDLHLGKWREVMNAYPNRIRKGWKTIYGHIRSRMDYIHITKAKLGIKLDIPLSKQDPLDKLNDLTNKKRKHANEINDYFKANKRLKSSIQYEDHLPGTVLNKHVLGMLIFNSYYRQDFVTIEDLKDFLNTMLYTVQEIFFIRYQGPRLDDHARTFSSLLLAEVDKRNQNPLKQMRTIK